MAGDRVHAERVAGRAPAAEGRLQVANASRVAATAAWAIPDHPASVVGWLRAANGVAARALAAGRHPFGAILVAPDGRTVLAEQGNVSGVEHAESELARQAARRHAPSFLAGCTLVTTVEPCAMCAGTQYWAGIGRLVYGVAERDLLAITGDHPENPTLDLPCREVFARGQRAIEVIGPVPAVAGEILALHRGFWQRERSG